MFTDVADALVWTMRMLALTGLGWGAWIVFSHLFLPAPSERRLQFEHFATLALLVVLISALGGVLQAT